MRSQASTPLPHPSWRRRPASDRRALEDRTHEGDLEAIFALVGLLLTATLFVLVKADQYFWMLFAGGLAILGVIAGIA